MYSERVRVIQQIKIAKLVLLCFDSSGTNSVQRVLQNKRKKLCTKIKKIPHIFGAAPKALTCISNLGEDGEHIFLGGSIQIFLKRLSDIRVFL